MEEGIRGINGNDKNTIKKEKIKKINGNMPPGED